MQVNDQQKYLYINYTLQNAASFYFRKFVTIENLL